MGEQQGSVAAVAAARRRADHHPTQRTSRTTLDFQGSPTPKRIRYIINYSLCARHGGLGVAENLGDRRAAGALDIHKVRVRALYQTLQLVHLGLIGLAGVPQIADGHVCAAICFRAIRGGKTIVNKWQRECVRGGRSLVGGIGCGGEELRGLVKGEPLTGGWEAGRCLRLLVRA